MEPKKIELLDDVQQVNKASLPAVSLNTGAIVLSTEQTPEAERVLAQLDFQAMVPADIIRLGLGAEQALQSTLDGFLARTRQEHLCQALRTVRPAGERC
ncbi:hypothetical protein ACVOMV_27195 (plasmid) [Mesorhizobium atlanticum]|uniref:hypothetical protein n=1 Tax=Mesorhizobium atlanticum TaxID=2233532 RepID=UPI00370371AA